MDRYGVLGATSWGVTLASLLARRGASVEIVARTADEAASVDASRGLSRLPEVRLGPTIAIVPSADWNAEGCAGLVSAVPVQGTRAALRALHGGRDLPLLSASKGIEIPGGLRISQVAHECGWPIDLVSVLSGPNLAREVGQGLPAAAVVAGPGAQAAAWQEALSGGTFRVYRSADVVGVELAGAGKNVIAIAAGVAAGLGFGANTIASLVTRGLAEVTRLGVAQGAEASTFLGLAGVGDLAATCFSPLSRNRRLGEALARGVPVAEARAQLEGVAEGEATAPMLVALARASGVELPIAEQVEAVLAGRSSVVEAMAALLGRGLAAETT